VISLALHELGVARMFPFGGGKVAAIDDEGGASDAGGIFAGKIAYGLGNLIGMEGRAGGHALQAVVQGLFAGAGAVFLFTRAVFLLGASRAALFPALVPPFTLLIGFIVLGEAPSVSQLVGLVVVVFGFWLTQRN